MDRVQVICLVGKVDMVLVNAPTAPKVEHTRHEKNEEQGQELLK